MTLTERRERARLLMQEFMAAEYPPRLKAEEDIAGVDFMLTDDSLGSCVYVWLSGTGELDDWRRGVVQRCLEDLYRLLPELTEQELPYVNRLIAMGQLALGRPAAAI
ncbi:hypothetical protein [Oryzihumus leptocrescens]|uniref:hypothetical protein n=1 Tax=Oryzihumus leptocrescens TaxID=297536 RepID=UPI001151E534|nr:hypothetical protein [Oryzihumus leptocrescens]